MPALLGNGCLECRLEKDLDPSFWFIKRRVCDGSAMSASGSGGGCDHTSVTFLWYSSDGVTCPANDLQGTQLGRERGGCGFFSAALSLQSYICWEEGANSLPSRVCSNPSKKWALGSSPWSVLSFRASLSYLVLVAPFGKNRHIITIFTPNVTTQMPPPAWSQQSGRQDRHPGVLFIYRNAAH